MKKLLILAVIALSAAIGMKQNASAMPVQVHLRAKGQPVNWGKKVVSYQYMGYATPDFEAQVPEGVTLLLDAFLIENRGGVLSSLSPEVRIEGKTITVDVSAIDNSLRCAGALAWSGDKLYVAEPRSNDEANRFVRVFSARGEDKKFDVETTPRAIAVSPAALYVAGQTSLAAFDLKTSRRLWNQPITFASGQMARLGDKLFLGDKSANAVRVFDAKTGASQGSFSGEGDSQLKTEIGHSDIGVCAGVGNKLIVSDAFAVREFDASGKFIRKIADVRGGSAVACDAQGNVAVMMVWAKDADNGGFPQVWKFDAQGKPLQRMARVYMRGPAALDLRPPDEKYKMRTLGGLIGKLLSPGGIVSDDAGNLYLSERNDAPQSGEAFYNTSGAMESDGGVVQISRDGETMARIGSRFSDGKSIGATLARRKKRVPLARVAAVIKEQRALRLLAWGDSISQTDAAMPAGGWHGGASDHAHNWIPVLGGLLEKQFAIKVIAEANGVGGQNVEESLSRNPVGTQSQIVQHDLILIELGTNDQGFHVRTTTQFSQSLREMLTALIVSTDSDIVLVSPGPIFGSKSPQPPAEYIAAMKAVGKEFGVPVVDMAAAFERRVAQGTPLDDLLAGPEDAHPKDAGHALWAQAVADVIANELKIARP